MRLLTAFFRMLINPPLSTLLEDQHAQLLHNWIRQPDPAFLDPQCTWQLDEGHPLEGNYQGSDFYERYTGQLSGMFAVWNPVVLEVIGSAVGGIVVGEYQFQRMPLGLRYTAPFAHFYRIAGGQIMRIRYCMGSVRIDPQQAPGLSELTTLLQNRSLN